MTAKENPSAAHNSFLVREYTNDKSSNVFWAGRGEEMQLEKCVWKHWWTELKESCELPQVPNHGPR